MDKHKDIWINTKIDGQTQRQMDKHKDIWINTKIDG